MGPYLPLAKISALLITVFFGAFPLTVCGNTLHHHMTKNDLEYFFGVDNHLEVPEYNVIIPYQSDESGLPLHDQRQRRAAEPSENKFYKVPAFGNELHLSLALNKKLMSPNLVMETRHADGTMSRDPVSQNTYYLGHVMSDPGSMVAVSDDEGGLTGMVKLSSDTLFIHPLPTHLAKRAVPSDRKATPHIIYKKSSQIQVDDHEEETKREFKKILKMPGAKTGMEIKTIEVTLMLEADTAEKLQSEKQDPLKFLLLLGNMISGLFMDPSIGEIRIYYTISKIIVIDKEVFGANYSESKDIWMNKLKEYVSTQNNPDDASQGDSDVSTLVYSMQTGKGGLASFNNMCEIDTVNVNSMTGLQTALIIAHETGHNLGVGHDGKSKECPENTYLMSPELPGGASAETWSVCSSRTIQDFLRSSRSRCLDDHTEKTKLEYKKIKAKSVQEDIPFDTQEFLSRKKRDSSEVIDLKEFNKDDQLVKLPGEVVSADEQCALQYGEGHRQCSQMKHDCGHLWCTTSDYWCVSKHAPAADGTPCGSRNWCIKGECVDNGRPHINGWWSEWSGFTPCTRTCGGGVQHRTRTCTNPPPSNGGKECQGESTGYWRICNTLGCHASNVDTYRDEQCVKARGIGATAYYIKDPCSLICKSGGLAQKYGNAADGTRCQKDPSVYNVCIGGVCKAADCNQVLGSNVKFDRCGVCGGNGNTCKHMKDVYIKQWKELGKENADLIVELPIGTLSATFLETSDTFNRIGIKPEKGDYLIDLDERKTVKLTYGGASITYKNKKKRYADSLEITGPTTEKLQVMFIAEQGEKENLGVEYDVLYPIRQNFKLKLGYKWIVGDWSACSATCARGAQKREVRCVLIEDGSAASDDACDKEERPTDEHECNQQPCPPEWQVSDWTPCSKTCGTGRQTRKLKCLERISFDNYEEIPSSNCDPSKLPDNFQLTQSCNKILCKAEWNVHSEWSGCSTPCGSGFRERLVSCLVTDEDEKHKLVPEEQCAIQEKPPEKQECDKSRVCLKDDNYQCYPENPCKNGAICVEKPPGDYKCDCLEGFEGKNCEVKVDPCSPNPCGNNGTCQRVSLLDYVCACPEWYKGKNCENKIKPCDKHPCHNGGTCVNDQNDPTNFNCLCRPWTTGKYCGIKKDKCDEEPCNGHGYCLSSQKDPSWHKCYCDDFSKGKNCEIQIFPCDTNPCVNGATCRNDKTDKAVYHCDCPDGYSGKNCQVPSFNDIACFKFSKDLSVLGDFSKEVKWKATDRIIKKCAELAFDRGYKIFTLGNKGLCLSGKNASQYYYKRGVEKATCKNGVGVKGAMFVYTFEAPPKFTAVGCYKENDGSMRLLKNMYASFVSQKDPKASIMKCAFVARDMKIEYFALQNNGECWTDDSLGEAYETYEKAEESDCKDGIGGALTNFVYRME